MTIGKKIKTFIVDEDIKQVEISKEARIPENKLSLSLNGKRKMSVEEFADIVNAISEISNKDVDANKFIKK